VAGAGGKMGQALIEGVLADSSLQLAAALDAAGSPALGRNAGGIKVSSDVRKALAAGDVLIDFTRPEGTIAHLEACARAGKPMVIGTTGISAPLRKAILQAARKIPIAMSPNFAVGVNAVFRLVEVAAGILGNDFDVEIVEAHHRHKVDAPSGTALKLGNHRGGLKRDLRKNAKHGREAIPGSRPSRSDSTPFAAAISSASTH
jgi:4-hydroxy-tetrahydrodipicolinate reductase